MPSLEELQTQIAELTRQAEEIKASEKLGVVAEARDKIQMYGITARELGLEVGAPVTRGRERAAASRARPEPRYRDEHGNEWSGGRGRKPFWVLDIQNTGGDIEQYRIAD